MLIHFQIVYDYFSTTMAKLSGCNRDRMAHIAQNIYCPPFYKKNLPTLDFDKMSIKRTEINT